MKPKTCQYCVYSIEPVGSAGAILVCPNKADGPGRLHHIEPNGRCRNFQPKNPTSRRGKPPSPENDEVRYIPLTQGKFAIVDADDYDRLAKYKWSCQRSGYTFYASRANGQKRISMHREIMNAPEDMQVDHIDYNGLNNRKSDLRLCTHAENVHNSRPRRNSSSRYKGVCWHKHYKKWQVSIGKSGKRFYLGRYDDEIEAALAYDRKAEELFGEFAYLNFPKIATKAADSTKLGGWITQGFIFLPHTATHY